MAVLLLIAGLVLPACSAGGILATTTAVPDAATQTPAATATAQAAAAGPLPDLVQPSAVEMPNPLPQYGG